DLKCIGTEVEQSKFYSDSPEAKQVMYMFLDLQWTRWLNEGKPKLLTHINCPLTIQSSLSPTYQKDDKQEDAK
ncbi:8908_t:CDS:2, partial [Cetraspora pellucida]